MKNPSDRKPSGWPERRQAKHNAAHARAAAWAALSPAAQLAALDARLGVGVGAVKQRARLARALNGGK